MVISESEGDRRRAASELLTGSGTVPGPARDPTASRLARARTVLPRNGGVRPAAHGRAGPFRFPNLKA